MQATPAMSETDPSKCDNALNKCIDAYKARKHEVARCYDALNAAETYGSRVTMDVKEKEKQLSGFAGHPWLVFALGTVIGAAAVAISQK